MRYLTFQQLKKKQVLEVWATKIFLKDEMIGRVNIVRRIFEKIEVTGPKKVDLWTFFQIN